MNRIFLMGRLTRDPEVRYGGAQNIAIARFSVAVDRRFKREGQPDADFFNCTAFRQQAEFIEKYIHKGTKVVIEGEMQNDNYTNKQGQMVYGFRVIVSSIEFAESKAASQQNASAPVPQPPAGTGSEGSDGEKQPAPDDFMNVPDSVEESLPFN
ncbi:MAG: single-stranded DNA-binding protein [Lachnospiraceae bacterium]|uniref:Single-stranded DNA-binding protein n=1 Tax=Candidatus Weimeria bifida TaxID=2599074 RepID=A0A6N7J301_9FIRM|nr:single-stranded DNA-binding protein [Candidatus Weimeria bifida]RRF95286.1 MAG: single-stranded DNA-binding protein [Lachnospiraceae bacterium]